MRILGLDFGSKTVGVAVTDALGMTARGVEIIRRSSSGKLRKTLARIEELVRLYDIEIIVLGYPLLPDGTEGERVEMTREFAHLLQKRVNKKIVFQDERFTTVAAYEIMEQMGIRKEERSRYIDQIAAMVILEDYLHQCEQKRKDDIVDY